jgi:hypothetical protein
MAVLLAMSSNDFDKTLKRSPSRPCPNNPASRDRTTRSSGADANAIALPPWFVPTEKDVVCGWARQNHKHPGNYRFRKLVEHSAPLYAAAKTKLGKSQVIAAVVEKVRRDSIGGGFVKKDFQSGRWYEIGDDKARDKVGHAIRRVLDEKKRPGRTSQNRKAKAASKAKQNDNLEDSLDAEKVPNLASIDDFFVPSTGGNLMSNEMAALAMGFNLPANILPQQKSDNVVVPSFLFQRQASNMGGVGTEGGASTTMNTGSFGFPSLQNTMGNIALLNEKAFAPSSNSALFQSQQQQQFDNKTPGIHFLGQSSYQGLLQQMQANSNSSGMVNLSQNNQFLPQPHAPVSMTTVTQLNSNGVIQQTRFAELLAEQQRMNNRRLSLAGETGFGSVSMPNNTATCAAPLPNNVGSLSMFPSSLSNRNIDASSSSVLGQMPLPSASHQNFGMNNSFGASSSLQSNAAMSGVIGDSALLQYINRGMDDSNSNDKNPNENPFL